MAPDESAEYTPSDDDYASGDPKSEKSEDQFDRYGFAKRIATLIARRTAKGCFVIGVNGVWGEGKTTILKFVETELTTEKNLETLWFNPWRYAGGDDLLTQFYTEIALKLGKKIKRVGTTIKEYYQSISPLVKGIGVVADSVQPGSGTITNATLDTTSRLIPKSSVEKLKKRLAKILAEKQTKVVVFIDDFDRLDTEELAELFSLIKVNADINGIVYVIAFDKNYVSRTLGEKYVKQGTQFLEKLINLQLDLPRISQTALSRFWQKGIFEILDDYSINDSWADDAIDRLQNRFSFITPRIKTPRQAEQHWNAFRFALSGLQNEVEYGDLLLLEWLRIEDPKAYRLIRDNSSVFLGSNEFSSNHSDKENAFSELLQKNKTNLSADDWNKVRGTLFPSSLSSHSRSDWGEIWFRDKRVCSPKYFDRYFHLGLPTGEISETLFDELICDDCRSDRISELFSSALEINPFQLIQRLQTQTLLTSPARAEFLIKEIIRNAESFRDKYHDMFSSPLRQASWLIADLLMRVEAGEKTALTILTQALACLDDDALNLFAGVIELITSVKGADFQLNDSDFSQLVNPLLRRYKNGTETNLGEWFIHFSGWYREENQKEWENWSKTFLVEDSSRALEILKIFAPKRLPDLFVSNLNDGVYDSLTIFFDMEIFASSLTFEMSPEIEVTQEFPENRGKGAVDDSTLIDQFIWLHKHHPRNKPDRGFSESEFS